MNTFSKKRMHVLSSALVVIVATGCAAKAGTSDSGMMQGKSDGMMQGTPDGMMQGKPGGMMQGVSNVTLGGSQEVPPVNTTATGSGEISVTADKSVSGSIMTTGINAKAAHIHAGAAGSNGPVVVPLVKSAENRWSVPPGAMLNDDQYASYMAGNLYVNVHSAAHPDGEIRGQLSPQ